MAEPRGVFAEEVGGNERSGKTAEPKENIDKIQRRRAMGRRYVAAQSIGRGDDDAAADSEKEQMRCDGSKTIGSRKKSDGQRAQGQAQNQSGFLALVVDERAHADGG